MPIDEYKEKFEFMFNKDISFSKKFLPVINSIINSVNIPTRLRDNLGTNLDQQGYDLTLNPIHIGMRIRRYKWLSKNEFTQDDNERQNMDCDYYFYGYATIEASKDPKVSELQAYMLFDYQDFKRLRGTKKIPCKDRIRNKTHSLVAFNCYSLSDIENNCRILVKAGSIGIRIIHPEKLEFYPYASKEVS